MKQPTYQASWIVAVALGALAPCLLAGCAATDGKKSGDGLQALSGNTAEPKQSWTAKLTAPFKADANGNRTATANDNDALSLSKQPNKKNPDLIVAMAQMQERAGKIELAEKEYQRALKIAPKHLGALLGYAHLHDRRNKMDEATKLYQRAVAAHPDEAAVHNDLGLCYHRRGMLPEAQASLSKAIELAPDRKLYRNNLASVLVERGQYDVALSQMTAAHGAAAGHYNMGYLMSKKGDNQRALAHFQQAAAIDPTLKAAQQWVAKLSAPGSATGPMLTGPTSTAPGLDATSSIPQGMSAGPRYPEFSSPASTTGQLGVPPKPADIGTAAFNKPTNIWSSPPAAVRYPNQTTSAYQGTAALPPTPEQMRQ